MHATLRVAVSPCPNDTFIFGGWILGRTGEFKDFTVRFLWDDVETLNTLAASGGAEVIKVSAATALRLKDKYSILSAGGAFGLSNGPRLVARPELHGPPKTIAIPGRNTTAFQLLSAAIKTPFTPVPMVYDRIVESVTTGATDAGLLIHESTLVYDRYGLKSILDLGRWWEQRSAGLPLPLGCIVIDKRLGTTVPARVEEHIRQSLTWAKSHTPQIRPLLKALAQELDDPTLDAHIAAYVNDLSLDMGPEGRKALDLLKDITQLRAATDIADVGNEPT